MVQVVTISEKTSFYDLETNFNLQLNDDRAAFAEWQRDLPELTTYEKERLDQVKAHFLALTQRSLISENLVKMAVVSPLLELAGFYNGNVQVRDEIPVEISGLDQDVLYRGRIDILVFQEKLWVVAIESKHSQFSLNKAMPQALAYMLASPNANADPPQDMFGLLTNGSDFRFLKVTHQSTPVYSVSSIFSLVDPGNDLYTVLQILKALAQSILP
ncbi:MAG: restriction endonuclease subunit R [Cyanothece sp. SIO2G6]|nr:restriction endonuclease subunit R [Cyanothece sp. SIO2G6]